MPANNGVFQVLLNNSSSYGLTPVDSQSNIITLGTLRDPTAKIQGSGPAVTTRSVLLNTAYANDGAVQFYGVKALFLYRLAETPDTVLAVYVMQWFDRSVVKLAFLGHSACASFTPLTLDAFNTAAQIGSSANCSFFFGDKLLAVEATAKFLPDQPGPSGLQVSTVEVSLKNNEAP
ncbi:hypothetical protein PUNSTDRAFT_136960 [Punctularia strigosozonata HHB-11173 SS5]|uniref:uncharacterized protein n=1 Tax=Punctularia strigosozonata (strain HHB-11173) TaxID=741275 RepID=UPI00044169E4|nr:uncharacterized protein PUNSTDRAFT_136960 [Punctularia strigosozonata HHB-11173 SS5]EIN06169.1 hypothetical protein PUNSTDRAFT_136960 [Punctularia strigosozonata HHB-11173 SS5]